MNRKGEKNRAYMLRERHSSSLSWGSVVVSLCVNFPLTEIPVWICHPGCSAPIGW